MQSKITREHLGRKAYIYIRQSSMDQVRDNRESGRLQYQLVDRVKALGWAEPLIIDEDLGISGVGQSRRLGFSRLLSEVCNQAVGAIFCLEASRLARNNREWYKLIDYCSIVNTLLVDLDGIYDPGNVSDRVFLGMKGTMSEYESGIFRQRSRSAIEAKAGRGELYLSIPSGYILNWDGSCQKNPDQRVQDSIALIFKKFAELGVQRQVLIWFRQEGIEVPTRQGGYRKGKLLWKLPSRATLSHYLKNPFYAGAYSYGRTESRVHFADGQPVKRNGYVVPMEKWKVLIKDHHEGYISWQEYLANQKRLAENSSQSAGVVKGAPKKGAALLAGLLRCQQCGRKLYVRYSGAASHIVRYYCLGDRNGEEGPRRCINFNGETAHEAIVQALMQVVEPSAINAAREAQQLYDQQLSDTEQSLRNAITQAEYETGRCFEQYDLVDAKNRLVAQTLEDRWNQALQKVESLKQRLDDLRARNQALSKSQQEKLYHLAQNLKAAWNHPAADMKIKKRILQTLVQEIMASTSTDNQIILIVHWKGGKHTQMQVPRPKRKRRKKRKIED